MKKEFEPGTYVEFLWRKEGDYDRIRRDDGSNKPNEALVTAQVTHITSKFFMIVKFVTEPIGHQLTIQEHNFPLLREVSACAIALPSTTGGRK
ncbi:MAG: hypothetical protein PHD72_04250 [Patescibacteria group bacterium]|nr:hypothetical protein [Patescibacteria group bacterium]